MFPIQDQISVVTRSQFESQLMLLSALSNKALDSAEKLMSLNIGSIKSALAESAQTLHQLCAAGGPQEILALSTARTQPAFEKAFAYGRNVAYIASGAQTEFMDATHQQISKANAAVLKLVDDVAKNAPSGSASVIEIMQVAIDNATKGFDQIQRTSKQASQVIEANINAVMDQIVPMH